MDYFHQLEEEFSYLSRAITQRKARDETVLFDDLRWIIFFYSMIFNTFHVEVGDSTYKYN